MEDRPPPAGAMGVHQIAHRRMDTLARQRLHHQGALPGLIGRGLPMLEQAPAAHAEMAAHRHRAVRAGGNDGLHLQPVLLAHARDGFPRQGVSGEQRAVSCLGDGIPLGAHAGDDGLHHGFTAPIRNS
jgi:hypothetical protein